jgi:hypothetical protein
MSVADEYEAYLATRAGAGTCFMGRIRWGYLAVATSFLADGLSRLTGRGDVASGSALAGFSLAASVIFFRSRPNILQASVIASGSPPLVYCEHRFEGEGQRIGGGLRHLPVKLAVLAVLLRVGEAVALRDPALGVVVDGLPYESSPKTTNLLT